MTKTNNFIDADSFYALYYKTENPYGKEVYYICLGRMTGDYDPAAYFGKDESEEIYSTIDGRVYPGELVEIEKLDCFCSPEGYRLVADIVDDYTKRGAYYLPYADEYNDSVLRNDKKVVYANACYTGGGFYSFVGKFADGTYFVTSNDHIIYGDKYPCVVNIRKRATFGNDYCWHNEWLFDKKNHIRDLYIETLWRDIICWIIENKPKNGNYNISDMKDLLNYKKGE